MGSEPLVDSFARPITYLRLSVTDRCDLRCTYCMPERMTFLPREDILSIEESYRLARGFMQRGIRRIRLTGGEPLVRRGIVDLLAALGSHIGRELDELTLTTNGTQLANHAEAIAAAGVRRINVSLDTLDRSKFAAIARRDALPQVLEGIAAAKAAGLAVKINTVAQSGVNADELPALMEWAHGEGFDISFIETMPLGTVDHDRASRLLSLSDLRRDLAGRYSLSPSSHRTGGPSRYFEVAETGGRVGFITPMSDNFCDGCNRVRVTATGQLYPCLGGSEAIDLRAAMREGDDSAFDLALDRAMHIKPRRHEFRIDKGNAVGPARHMSVTGG
ncbi:GTP 3',8-cyclase MoaA [Erythrobacter sp. HKB08]|uniref:GTP 3',8-cyclase MoaA n=1 Tax=Erythrobacter sp. HKB08 TaxID=2502843 RepID=UPI0010089AAF|nr:GTP 3',8-cyclase MoaA [Erythrobacter sp. HKB08]